MALPTRGRPTSDTGKGRHKVCCHGTCTSSSAPTLAEENVEFVRFPKPCLSYRNAIPGSSFRRYHKISKCKECERAARWVHRCRRATGLVNIANIGSHTYICTKHFSSVESARSLQEDPHPATSGPMKKKRPPPKHRVTAPEAQRINKDNQSFGLAQLEHTSLTDHRDYCLSSSSDDVNICPLPSSNDTSHTVAEHENDPSVEEYDLQLSQDVPNIDDELKHDEVDEVEDSPCGEINWENLGVAFLKEGWMVELEGNKIILSRRCDRFIIVNVIITESVLEATVFGKVVNLPFYLTSMKMTEENIKLVMSIVANYRLCEGVNRPDLVDVQKECNDTKGFFCASSNVCRSYDCSGFIVEDDDSSVCPSCQDYYDALTAILNRINRNDSGELKKTINYRFLGRQQLQEVIQKKKKTIKSQRSKIVKLEKKISRMNQWSQ